MQGKEKAKAQRGVLGTAAGGGAPGGRGGVTCMRLCTSIMVTKAVSSQPASAETSVMACKIRKLWSNTLLVSVT